VLLAAISLGLLAAVSFAIVMFWPDAEVSGFSGFLDVPSFSNIAVPWLWAGPVQVLKSLFIVNIVLAVFNMIPIPPLDGSHVLENLLPGRMRFYFGIMRISGFMVILIVLVVLMYAGVLGTLVELAIRGASAPIRLVTHLG
jgi:Zn-dependent protease